MATPLIGAALAGGALIGLSATVLLATNGKVAGVSGIAGGILEKGTRDRLWRIVFIAGMLLGGLLGLLVWPERGHITINNSTLGLIAAGLLVGFGARLGNGCTSGHGVCGMARFSIRSVVATLTFIAAGVIAVLLTQHGLK